MTWDMTSWPPAERLSSGGRRPAVIGLAAAASSLPMLLGGAKGAEATIGVVLFAAYFLLVRVNTRAAFVTWIIAMAAVPPWLEVPVDHYTLTVPVVMSAIVVLSRIDMPWDRFSWTDLAVGCLVVLLVLADLRHTLPGFVEDQGLTQWALCYLAARRLYTLSADAIAGCLSVVGSILGGLAVLQTFIDFDMAKFAPFNFVTNLGQYQSWAPLQYRGGFLRAELTFGHSIALGGSLALCLPFALTTGTTRTRWLRTLLILGGTFATFSRGALIADGLVLLVGLLGSRATPTVRAVGTLLLTAIVVPLASLFASAISSATDTGTSTAYRVHLLSVFGYARPLGIAIQGFRFVPGQNFDFYGFQSIDSTILYVALYAGWLPTLLYVAPVVILAARGLRYEWRPLDTAVLSQIPLILTVAPLTQYQSFYWLVVGLAVSRPRAGQTRRLGRRLRWGLAQSDARST
jgi:hypothetical protein